MTSSKKAVAKELLDSFYRWYKPLRDHYTLLAVAKMQIALEKRKR